MCVVVLTQLTTDFVASLLNIAHRPIPNAKHLNLSPSWILHLVCGGYELILYNRHVVATR